MASSLVIPDGPGRWLDQAEIDWLTAEHEWLREELAYAENARRDSTCLDCPSALYDGADAHQARYPHHRVIERASTPPGWVTAVGEAFAALAKLIGSPAVDEAREAGQQSAYAAIADDWDALLAKVRG